VSESNQPSDASAPEQRF